MHVGGEEARKGKDCVCVYVAPITENRREEEGKRWVEKGKGTGGKRRGEGGNSALFEVFELPHDCARAKSYTKLQFSRHVGFQISIQPTQQCLSRVLELLALFQHHLSPDRKGLFHLTVKNAWIVEVNGISACVQLRTNAVASALNSWNVRMANLLDEVRELRFKFHVPQGPLLVRGLGELAQELSCLFTELISELKADVLAGFLQFVNGFGLKIAVELHLHDVDMPLPVIRFRVSQETQFMALSCCSTDERPSCFMRLHALSN